MHSDKSILKLTQKIEFIDFAIVSLDITLNTSIKYEKTNHIVLKITKKLTQHIASEI